MDRDILCDPLLVRVEDMGCGLLLPPGSGWLFTQSYFDQLWVVILTGKETEKG